MFTGDGISYDKWAQEILSGQWFKNQPFYQAPFYPYFLAIVYKLFGHDTTMVRVIHIILGSFSCVFILYPEGIREGAWVRVGVCVSESVLIHDTYNYKQKGVYFVLCGHQ